MKTLLAGALLLMLVNQGAWAATDLTGRVLVVNVNKSWGGIFIELEGGPVFEPGSACANRFAYVRIDDDYAKHFVALALAAKASGEPIRVATNGCISTVKGLVPSIEWMDHGIRQ